MLAELLTVSRRGDAVTFGISRELKFRQAQPNRNASLRREDRERRCQADDGWHVAPQTMAGA
jgi:hypothetical protein